MYKIYTDKQDNFSCDIKISGASLDKAVVRLIITGPDLSLCFEGHICDNKAIVPIKPLRGIFNVGDTGKICLEVIVDSTYLVPWESTFEVVRAVDIKAVVGKQGLPISAPGPKIDVSNVKIAELFRGHHA